MTPIMNFEPNGSKQSAIPRGDRPHLTKNDNTLFGSRLTSTTYEIAGTTPWSQTRTFQFDVERYQGLMNETSLTQEQREGFLEAIWTIITAFIDLGCGIHPSQQMNLCVLPNSNIFSLAIENINDAV